MKLFEHPDFEQAILQAAEHFREQRLRPAIIERLLLRRRCDTLSIRGVFEGGTSLSKGWDLIARFSEDIDIFLDPLAYAPALGSNAADRELKRLRDVVATHPALNLCLRREPNYRWLWSQRSILLSAALWRYGRSREPCARRSRHGKRREPTALVELLSYLAILGKEVYPSGRRETQFRCGCSTSGALSSRRCSQSMERSNC